jgi:Fe2+ or Zn2+ uptake regulation protein
MTALSRSQEALLNVVRESDGQWDTRNIDHVFHQRGGHLTLTVLAALRELEALGLVAPVAIPNGTGPAWRVVEVEGQ